MKLELKKFKEALSIVKPGLSSKEIIEQTTSFAFVHGTVVTYNDEICIMCPLPDFDLTGAIKADEFYKFIQKVKSETIDFEVMDNTIMMKSGRARAEFSLKTEITLPLDETAVMRKLKWADLPESFNAGGKLASAAASNDFTNAKLTCVHVTKKGIMEASDNYRIVTWDVMQKMPVDDFLIPAHSLKEAIRLNPDKIALTEGWVHFKNVESGVVISCRIFEEEYVNITPTIQKYSSGTKKVKFPDVLSIVLDKAEIFAQQQNSDGSVTITVKSGKMCVESRSDTAIFREVINCENSHNFSFSITPYLLKDILKEITVGEINDHVLIFRTVQWMYLTTLRVYTEEIV